MQNDKYYNNEEKKLKIISIIKLYKKIIKSYYGNINFVIFRKPYEKKIFFYHNNSIPFSPKKNEKYFLIKSFDNTKTIKINPNIIYCTNIPKNLPVVSKMGLKNDTIWNNNSFLLNEFYNKEKYKNLIKKAIGEIKKGTFQKVVLSKYVKIPFHNISLEKTFQKLMISYPNALISIWYDIHHGFWIGCTPELLIKFQNKKLLISILAGTIWSDYAIWTSKEIKEHNIVVKYVEKILRSYNGFVTLKKTGIKRMGHLQHLETLISFSFLKTPNYNEVLNHIYPTPSICGFPKEQSFDFIKKNEGYKRNFYTGYIGIVNEKYMELYLNLRCARIKKEKKEITLYAGSGITIDSDIDQELIETENKMKNILSQFIFK
ncbi:chorismate-binding protein [Blattabacterium cuenoti]|uniref:chorismate-binding protein n=1 Tax=Blattabacterium cuenoti TaxID=1653831 RepID=UPI00163BBAE7|nr:chorismate-binding protein [Blattabacterium cuenoti]